VSQLLDTSGLQVWHNVDISGNLSVAGTFFAGTVNNTNLNLTGYINVGGNADISGDTRIAGRLDVSGDTEISGNLTVYQLTDTSGLYVLHNLDVSGDTEISGNLTVYQRTATSDLYVLHNLDVSGDTEISGNLTVYQLIDTSGLYVLHNLDVSGDMETSGNLTVYQRTNTSGLHVQNTLDVSGNVNIDGYLNARIPIVPITYTITDPSDLDLCSNSVMYVITNNISPAAPLVINTTITTANPHRVGAVFYFVARGTNTLQIAYTGNSILQTTNPISNPTMLTLLCIGTNDYSAST
jgi:cytoskeletal protein CcmA (bactofilin family)